MKVIITAATFTECLPSAKHCSKCVCVCICAHTHTHFVCIYVITCLIPTMGTAFHILLKKSFSTLRSQRSFLFSSESFIVLSCTFSSIILLELTFTYSVSQGSIGNFLHKYPIVPLQFIERPSFSHQSSVPPLIHQIHICMCLFLSSTVLQFYLCILGPILPSLSYYSICSYYTVFKLRLGNRQS